MKTYLIQENLIQALGQYLLSKPMAETENLVNGLRSVQEYKPETKPEIKEVKPGVSELEEVEK